MSERFGVLLLSGSHERAHYAFVLASAAAAVGREVTLFATNRGCRALLHDWRGLDDAGREGTLAQRGVAGLEELRSACIELGVRMLVCEAGMLAVAIDPAGLLPAATVVGVVTFLEATRGGTVVTC